MSKLFNLHRVAEKPARRFASVYERISPYTILAQEKCRQLYNMARSVRQLPGDVAELGVYRGGVSLMLAWVLPNKRVHAFDTFGGICNATEIDLHHNGDFANVSPKVIRRLNRHHIIVHQGYFPTTAAELPPDQRFCLCHFDGDTYQSTKDFLKFFYPRTVRGGLLVFDDYLWEHCPGVEKALREFLQDKPEKIKQLVTFQGFIQKQCRHKALGTASRRFRPTRQSRVDRIRSALRLK